MSAPPVRPGQTVDQHTAAGGELGLEEGDEGGEEPRQLGLGVPHLPPPPGHVEGEVGEAAGVVVLEVVRAVHHGGDVLGPEQLQVSGSSLTT